MIESDVAALMGYVNQRWPHSPVGAAHRPVWVEDLDSVEPDAAKRAVVRLARTGREFPPTSGQIVAELARELIGAPDWAEVRRQLVARRRAMTQWSPPEWECPLGACDGSGYVAEQREGRSGRTTRCDCWPERLAARQMTDTLHPLIREFIETGFMTREEADALGRGATDKDSLTLTAQCRDRWESFASRVVERAALAPGESLPAIEPPPDEMPRRVGRRRGELRRLAPSADDIMPTESVGGH
jgi:hypothetical protein